MLISIIIPAYNVSTYIEECIHSAFTQTYPDIEVICIDNNSSDNTWQILEELQQQYSQLIIEKETNPGAPAARNKGLTLSKGEWIQFLDADDLLMPDKIKHQVALLHEAKQDVSFIAATCLKRNLEGNEQKITLNKDNPFKSLFSTQLGNTCANLWNCYYIKKINGWDESQKSSQEADLMFRLLQIKDEVIYDDEPLTIVRERPEGQISKRGELVRLNDYFHLRWEFVEWLKKHRKEHYEHYKDFYLIKLFQVVQKIGLYDLSKATLFYNTYLSSEKINKLRKMQRFFLKLFGFKTAERIRQFILTPEKP
jgi:glycosyltransferase involved in cell wall biosynthesis